MSLESLKDRLLSRLQPETNLGPWLLPEVRFSLPNPKQVAFTFDDGPNPAFTSEILKLLRSRGNLRATFFMVGSNLIRYPEIALEVHKQGQAIGNHTLSHSRQLLHTSDQFNSEVYSLSCEFLRRIEYIPASFRPPYGLMTNSFARILSAHSISASIGNVYPRDKTADDPAILQQRILHGIHQRSMSGVGSIVILHDGDIENPRLDRNCLVEALKPLLDRLLEERYEFVGL